MTPRAYLLVLAASLTVVACGGGATPEGAKSANDADVWAGKRIPQAGDREWLAGPIVATADAQGRLAPLATGFVPGAGEVGVYDVLADLDRNGTFDWSFALKDGADGEQKVGFTVQYSANTVPVVSGHAARVMAMGWVAKTWSRPS